MGGMSGIADAASHYDVKMYRDGSHTTVLARGYSYLGLEVSIDVCR